MQITEINSGPPGGAILFHGMAVTTRGRRYRWYAFDAKGRRIDCDREYPEGRLPDGRTLWMHTRPVPAALAKAAREAMRRLIN